MDPVRPIKLLLFIIALLCFTSTPNSSAGLVVHEWGTFTSVQGSNGEAMAGLEHEEELLPSFVHNLDPAIEIEKPMEPIRIGIRCPAECKNCCKGMCCDNAFSEGTKPLQVTQKMETPVIYFYSDHPVNVDLTVNFPKGIISQYYPNPTTVFPPGGQKTNLGSGQIRYSNLEVLTEKPPLPPVLAGNVYGPARETLSNTIRSHGENEKFVFYRGLGNFQTALKVTSNLQTLKLFDTQGRGIPYLLAVHIRDGKGAFKELGGLFRNQIATHDLQNLMTDLSPKTSLQEFETQVGPVLTKALQNTGLFADEAKSMVNTWKLSYFHTDGFRILYILPREETDTILPIKISPQPEVLVRTLVGRVEVLTVTEESNLLAEAKDALEHQSALSRFSSLGRFKEPKLLRLLQITSNSAVKKFIAQSLH